MSQTFSCKFPHVKGTRISRLNGCLCLDCTTTSVRQVVSATRKRPPSQPAKDDYVCPVTGYRGVTAYQKHKCRCDSCRKYRAARNKPHTDKQKLKRKMASLQLMPRCTCYKESARRRKELAAMAKKEQRRMEKLLADKKAASVRFKQRIEKAKQIHNEFYNYDYAVEVPNGWSRILIKCPQHGFFMQTLDKHVSKKQGCPDCGRQRSINAARKQGVGFEEWLRLAKAVHGDTYDYSSVLWFNTKSKVIIKCPKHGPFAQEAYSHVRPNKMGHGCPKCSRSKGEEKICRILNALGVDFVEQWTHPECRSPNSGYPLRFDFYLPTHNLLIEFDGDQHKSEASYKSLTGRDDWHEYAQRDAAKVQFAEQNGIRLIRIDRRGLSTAEETLVNALKNPTLRVVG